MSRGTNGHPLLDPSTAPLDQSDSAADAANAVAARVDLLGVLFILWGVLTMLVGASTLALGVAAAALVRSTAARGGGFAAGLTAAAFTTLAVMAIIWGVAHIVVGAPLRRRRRWSRHAAIALGTIDLLLLPYGTALGVFGLWVLLRQDAREIFESGHLVI